MKIRPGKFYYAISALLILFGFIYMFYIAYTDKVTQQRVIAPGSHEIILSHAGSYTIYNEFESTEGIDGKPFVGPVYLTGLNCSLVQKGTDEEVVLKPWPYGSSSTYSGGEKVLMKTVYNFTITEPGVYQLNTSFSPDADTDKAILVVDQGILSEILPFFIPAPCIIFGVLFGYFVYKKRKRALKEALDQMFDWDK